MDARIFHKPQDYEAFVQLLMVGKQHAQIELFSFCLMPNHWHLVLRPKGDTDLAAYLSWVSNTHVKRYRAHYADTSGHLYQGRYKSFAVEDDEYLLTLFRYVEANPLRAGKVDKAQDWVWSSLGFEGRYTLKLLSPWPIDRPRNWTAIVNQALGPKDVQRIRTSIERDRPLGRPDWTASMAARMGIEYTLNPRGRPKNPSPPR
jgi:REP-associated tyrosine transposase